MLKKLYSKSELWFALAWIIAYCVLMSAGDALSEAAGLAKSVTLPVALLLSAILLLFLRKNRLCAHYGLRSATAPARSVLYYLPVLLMLTANLWYGITLPTDAAPAVLYVLTMLCVGFLEEVIFRGLLFEAMRKDSPRAAVIVSSISFGIGHIINLFNGSGADLLSGLLQVVYATAAGFMFVMLYCRTESLLVCIAAHGIFNALSVLASEAAAASQAQLVTAALLTLITGSYAAYLALSERRENNTASKE